MKISVCMGIYNGKNYIEEQLLSILHQTVQPDEVVLCDDNSTDGTAEHVEEFLVQNGLQEKWRFVRNHENKGYPANFYYAMSLCSTDVVFLADQDDVWHKEKIEKMLEVFRRKPEAKAVCCKFGLIDSEGKDIHTLMAPTRTTGTGELREVSIADVFYKCEWPGMVMAYRNAWYQSLDLEKDLQIPHDFLICVEAAEEKGFFQLDEELAYHRRHDNNAGGEEHRFSKLLNKRRKMKEIETYLRILNAFDEEKVLRTEEGSAALLQKLESMNGRYEALKSGKIVKVLQNAWKHRSSVRPATVLCDICIVKRKVTKK